jgi:ribonuclease P protein component
MRFRPEQHLRRQSDFRAVRERGRRINCGAFTFSCVRREPVVVAAAEIAGGVKSSAVSRSALPTDPKTPRVGLVASTSAVGHAVLRNRAKRRLRDIFRRHQAMVPAGCDLLLTARTAVTVWSMAELEQKFLEACRQAAPSVSA